MNREQRRAQEARAKMQRNTDRVISLRRELAEAIDTSELFRKLFFAVLRGPGRLVIPQADIQALNEGDSIDFRNNDRGDVVAEFKAGRS